VIRTVVALDTGTPLRRAQIRASATRPRARDAVTSTDDQGGSTASW
jgi:hypothetical protein